MAQTSVKIMLLGSNQALRDIQGLRKETNATAAAEKKALVEVTRAAKRAEQEKIRAAQRAATAEKKAAEQVTRATAKEAEKQRREADRLAEYWAKLAQKSADARIRAEERTQKTREKYLRETWRKAGGAISAGVSGVMAGGLAATATARGITGVDDVATRVQKANDFRERLIGVAGQAGLTDKQLETTQSQVMSAAMASGKGPDELVGVLETGQARFNDLKFFADNLTEISRMAKASNSDTKDFAQALGYIRQAFGLTEKEAMEAGYKMIQSANKGSVEVAAFARDFASVAGIFAQSTGMTGMEGVSEFLGASQSAGTLGKESAETATMVERLVAFLGNPTHVKEIKKATGVNVAGKPLSQVVAELAENSKFNKEGVRADLFGGDIIPNQAIMSMIAAYRRVQSGEDPNAIDINTIAAVDAQGGRDFTESQMRRFEKSGLLEMQRQAIEMQNDTITNLKDYNAQILAVTKASNKLEKALGTLSLWASAIGTAGVAGAGGSLAWKLLGGGGGAAAGAAGGAGAAAAGAGGAGVMAAMAAAGNASLGTLAAAGAAGIGTILAGVGAALAGGAAIGYGLDKTTEAVTGKGLSDRYEKYLMDQMGNWEDPARAKLEPIEGAIDVAVTVKDDRVDVSTQVGKSKGARIVSTQAGPNMASAL